jgi:HSP20 family protein
MSRAVEHLNGNPTQEVIMAGSHLPSLFTRRSDGLGSLLREIERTFDDFSRRSPLAGFAGFGGDATTPKVDVSEGKDAVEVTAELPGCAEKDINVTLSEGVLTIRGEKRTERDETDKDKNWHVIERSYGSFSRSIPLPFTPDSAKVEAKFDKGVLRVKLPKPAEMATKEKKIEIRGS